MPVHSNGPHRHRRRRHRRSRDPGAKHEAAETEADKKRILRKLTFLFELWWHDCKILFFAAPGQRVQFLLSHEDDMAGGGTEAQLEAHRIFSEMVELHGTDANQEWRETARYDAIAFV